MLWKFSSRRRKLILLNKLRIPVSFEVSLLFNRSVMSNSLHPHELYIYSLQSSSVHGISQARILEWVAISFCKGSSQSRYKTRVSKVHSLPLCHFWLISMTYLPYFPCQWPFQSYGRSTWTYLIQDGLSVNSIFYMLWSPCNIFTLILFKLH